MRNAQRTVNTIAVFGRRCPASSIENIVAGLAEVVGTPAAVRGDRATVHALPVDHVNAVFLALSLANTHLFQQALLAEQFLLPRLTLPLCCSHLLLAVDETTEVGLLTAVAEVEAATMVGVLLGPAIVEVVFVRRHALISKDTLSLRANQGLLFNGSLQVEQGAKLGHDWLRQAFLELDILLAARALHEGEGDAESCPPVAQKLHDAVRVEYVAAGQL